MFADLLYLAFDLDDILRDLEIARLGPDSIYLPVQFLRDEIELHLDSCEKCRVELAELRSVSSLLKKELPASPSIKLDEKVSLGPIFLQDMEQQVFLFK